jgi:hypothetical protein
MGTVRGPSEMDVANFQVGDENVVGVAVGVDDRGDVRILLPAAADGETRAVEGRR